MKIYETLARDPRQSALANSGQARINAAEDARTLAELRAELETFVCDGQYGDALERILQSYLAQLDRPRQNAAWVSGFYGSGKSHLIKILGHLWVDTRFEDGASARSLVRELPDDILALLRELDTRVARSGRPAVAAAGALPSGSNDHVRLTVLAVILRALGLPEVYSQAQFHFWLREQGYLDAVQRAIRDAGKEWARELNNLYVSGPLARAVLACDPDFARDEREARQVLRQRFPHRTSDLSTPEFLAAIREAVRLPGDTSQGPERDFPLTVLILDEAQQYLGASLDRAVTLTELAEAVQTQLDSRVMLVASGQSALASTELLQKLRDRFRITVQLSDTDVEAVTRRVLLHKKASALDAVRRSLDDHAGEVSKHLHASRLAERPADRSTRVEDYPLLPTRRRFWEECFRAVDAAGNHSQLRSQLRILHDALCVVADRPLGSVIPADALFDAIGPDLVNSGVLLNELATRIASLDDGSPRGKRRRRLAGLVFLVSRLPREDGVDPGVRATAATLADLMIEDLGSDSSPLRREIEADLLAMVADGTLMQVDTEYRLQTTQGAEWDRAYREKFGALGARQPEMKAKQDQLVAAAVQQVVGDIRLRHGAAKETRSLVLYAREDAPAAGGDQVVVWLRDGSMARRKDVEGEARARGHEDPVVHVFLDSPDDDLKEAIKAAEAARLVLEAKGLPTEPPEAVEAMKAMQSRRAVAEGTRDQGLRELVAAARVYQGGGNEVFGDSLATKIEAAAEASLSRLFPRFSEADHKAYRVAMQRAQAGSDEPLKVVSWDQATDQHPVVRQVLATIGSAARGAEVRRELLAPPFGWPKDAIDAALVMLAASGAVRATSNGVVVSAKQLDQNKIGAAEFRVERLRLGTSDKLALRGLYQSAGVAVKSGEEEAKADAFLESLTTLTQEAGGRSPLPEVPAPPLLDELRRTTGSERLARLVAEKDSLASWVEQWTRLAQRARKRLPRWDRLLAWLRHAEGLPVAKKVGGEIEAIRRARSLLEDTDYVTPLAKDLEAALRTALREAFEACRDVYQRERDQLEAAEAWSSLEDAQRAGVLVAQRLEAPVAPEVADEGALLGSLEARSLGGWRELAEGLPTRFGRARAEAARLLEPTTRVVSLPRATLRDEGAVRAWLASVEADLLDQVKHGPIILG